MTVKQIPDYDLDEMIVVTAPGQLRALADPLRGTLLDLLLERAATVTELALAVDRPKSTVAYHVNLLVDAGLLQVVRTRRVRAIEERYYGRVARTIYIGALHRDEDKQIVSSINGLAQAAAEAAPAHAADDLRCTLVHARIPREEVRNFWAAVQELARQFAQIPRAGDQVYGFAAGLYPTDAPTLPDMADGPADLGPSDLGPLDLGCGTQLRSCVCRIARSRSVRPPPSSAAPTAAIVACSSRVTGNSRSARRRARPPRASLALSAGSASAKYRSR